VKVRLSGDTGARSGGRQTDRADEPRRRGDDSRRHEGRRREEDRSGRNDDRRQDGRQKSDDWHRSGDKRSWEDWSCEERHRDRKLDRPRHKHDMSQRQDGRVRLEGSRQDDAIGRPRGDDRRQTGDDRRHSANDWSHEEGQRHYESRGKRSSQSNMDAARHTDHGRHHADERPQRDDRTRADDRGRSRDDGRDRTHGSGRTSDVRHSNDGHSDAAPQEWRGEKRPAPLPPSQPLAEQSGMASVGVAGDEQASQLSQSSHPAPHDRNNASNQMAEEDDRREQSHAVTAAVECASDRNRDKPAEQPPVESAAGRGTEEDPSSEQRERDAEPRGQRSAEDDERCSVEPGDEAHHESPDGSDSARSAGWDDDEAAEGWCSEEKHGERQEAATGGSEGWKEDSGNPAPPWREQGSGGTKAGQKWQRQANQQGKRPWVPRDWQDTSGGRGPKREKWPERGTPDFEIPVEERMLGRIIGREGGNLKNMRRISGATIECDDQAISVKIWGDSKQVKSAKHLVYQEVDKASQMIQAEQSQGADERQGPKRKVSPWRQKKSKPAHEQHTRTRRESRGELVFPLPRALYVEFVGPGGSGVQEVKNRTGASIHSEKGENTCRVIFKGNDKQIAAARREVLRLRMIQEDEEEVEVHVLKVCRKAFTQSRLQAIRRETDVDVRRFSGRTEEEYDRVRIKGTSRNVERAWCLVMEEALSVGEANKQAIDASASGDEDAAGSEKDDAGSSASCSESSRRSRKGRTRPDEGCQADRMQEDASPGNSCSAADSDSEYESSSGDVSHDEGAPPAKEERPAAVAQTEPREATTASSEAMARSTAEDGPASPDSPLAEQDPPRNESSQARGEGTAARSADGECGQVGTSYAQTAALNSSVNSAAAALLRASKRVSVGKEAAAAGKPSEGDNSATLRDDVTLPPTAAAAAAAAGGRDAQFHAPGLTSCAKAKASTPPFTESSGSNAAPYPQEVAHQPAPMSVGAASGEQGSLPIGAAPVIVKPRGEPFCEKLSLPENFPLGALIGSKGSIVKRLEEESGAKISAKTNFVEVSGETAEIVKRGVEKVREKIQQEQHQQHRKGKGHGKGWDGQNKGGSMAPTKTPVPPPPRPPAPAGNSMSCPAQSMGPPVSEQSNGLMPVGAVGAVAAAVDWHGPRTPGVVGGKSMGKQGEAAKWGWEQSKGSKTGTLHATYRPPSVPMTVPPRGKQGTAGSCKGSCKGGSSDWMSNPGAAIEGYSAESSMDGPTAAASFAHRPPRPPENNTFVQDQLQPWQQDVPEAGACGHQQHQQQGQLQPWQQEVPEAGACGHQQQQGQLQPWQLEVPDAGACGQQQQHEPQIMDQPQAQLSLTNVDLQHVAQCAEPRLTATVAYGQPGSAPGFAEDTMGVLAPPPGTFAVPSEWQQVPPGGGGRYGEEIPSYRPEPHGSPMMPSPEQQAQAAGIHGAATLPASEFPMEMWNPPVNPPGPETAHQVCNQNSHLAAWYPTGCVAQQEHGGIAQDFSGFSIGGVATSMAPSNVVDV